MGTEIKNQIEKVRKEKAPFGRTKSVYLEALEEEKKREDWMTSMELNRFTAEEKYWYRVRRNSIYIEPDDF